MMHVKAVASLVITSLVACSAVATTRYVPSEYATIQAGVDACVIGDTVLVAPGTYTGTGNVGIDFHGVDLVLLSEAGPETTVIDCKQSDRAIYLRNYETTDAVVEGFKIINGLPAELPGGGITCENASPKLVNLIISNCEASGGGAITLAYSTAFLQDLILEENVGRYDGGAISTHASDVEIHDCVIRNNYADWGGGIEVSSTTLLIEGAVIEENIAGNAGGGVYVHLDGDPTILGTRFENNTAVNFGGGGISFYSDGGTVRDCIFLSNRSGWFGGALCFENEDSTPLVENSIFIGNIADNGGGAFYIRMHACPTVRRCTLNENIVLNASVGAIQTAYWGTGVFENVIVANTAHGFGIHGGNPFADLTMICCDVYGNEAGDYGGLAPDLTGVNGNISEDPQFCGIAGSGNVYLQSDSPCAPANNDCSTLIGALPVGCDTTASRDATWGGIKSLY